jgi:hypothetical protein
MMISIVLVRPAVEVARGHVRLGCVRVISVTCGWAVRRHDARCTMQDAPANKYQVAPYRNHTPAVKPPIVASRENVTPGDHPDSLPGSSLPPPRKRVSGAFITRWVAPLASPAQRHRRWMTRQLALTVLWRCPAVCARASMLPYLLHRCYRCFVWGGPEPIAVPVLIFAGSDLRAGYGRQKRCVIPMLALARMHAHWPCANLSWAPDPRGTVARRHARVRCASPHLGKLV